MCHNKHFTRTLLTNTLDWIDLFDTKRTITNNNLPLFSYYNGFSENIEPTKTNAAPAVSKS
jgi:hypothetical protein